MQGAEPIPSTILTGASPPFFDAAEFDAFREKAFKGEELTLDEAARLNDEQYAALLNALFIRRLEEAARLYRTGRSRGRLGAVMALDLCRDAVCRFIPAASEHLGLLDEVCVSLLRADSGELARLLQPGLDPDDHKRHLSLIPKDNP